jgi:hypothetical protein
LDDALDRALGGVDDERPRFADLGQERAVRLQKRSALGRDLIDRITQLVHVGDEHDMGFALARREPDIMLRVALDFERRRQGGLDEVRGLGLLARQAGDEDDLPEQIPARDRRRRGGLRPDRDVQRQDEE